MKTKKIFYFFTITTLLFVANISFCSGHNISMNEEELRLFLLKGYISAKSVINDVRIEYQKSQIPVNTLPKDLDTFVRKRINDTTSTYEELFSSFAVEEYIQKNGKERWVNLYAGKSIPTEEVSYRAGLVKTIDSPRFKVFDGHYLLDYMSVKDDVSSIGRAGLDVSKTGFFKSPEWKKYQYSPVSFFGYRPGYMPDDVLSSSQISIEMEPEIINGLLTYKISAPMDQNDFTCKMNYWLSPERSCLPVKMEAWENGKFTRRMETIEFMELENGQWAIKSTLQRNFLDRDDQEKPLEIVNLLYTIRKIELHPEIDEDEIFSTSLTDLLDGVQIYDRTTSLTYFNGEGPVSDRRISNITNEALESLNEIQNQNASDTIEEVEIEKTELIDDVNKPLFSNTGILASQTPHQEEQEEKNKTSILGIAFTGTCILVSALITIVAFNRFVKKGDIKNV